MITVPAGIRVLVATKPVDFRKGGDGLAALVREALGEDPFSGTIFQTSRPRKDFGVGWAGLVLFWKRLEHGAFRWPPDRRWHHAIVCVAGSDWSRLHARDVVRPDATS
jgi:transposase